jgi:pimeloyl-ACP methyl ester carboxylesterase
MGEKHNNLAGITSKFIETERLKIHALFSGPENGEPVLFIHGNASSAVFWEEIMLKLPENFRGIAIDLRGYGDTEDKLIDASQGCDDWVNDIVSFCDAIGVDRYHVVGHSLGGAIVISLIAALGDTRKIASVTLVNPASPYGFGGTKDNIGTPCHEDFAGSGGGVVNPEFAKLMGEKNRDSSNPQASPRVVMNSFYWKPPFKPDREEDLLSSLLSQKVGEKKYPGDFVSSPNWPYVAPGNWGPINAASPKYAKNNVEQFWHASHKPHVLWVRGSDDQIVSDNSFFDIGTLGKLGLVPGWPGEEVYPPQPMVSQTRTVLQEYVKRSGSYSENVIADTGHSPFIEKPEEFMILLKEHLIYE